MTRVVSVLFLLLSLTVATREIPELYSLADDPSNDGQVFNWQGQPSTSITHRTSTKQIAVRVRAFTFAHTEHLSRASIAPVRTGQDILRLVGSLRT